MTNPADTPAHDPLSVVISPTEEEMSVMLGDDLFRLVASGGEPLIEMKPLAARASWRQRPSVFRLKFEDGRIQKGVRLASAKRTRQVVYIHEMLDHPSIPPLVGHRGAAFLQPWIPGASLTEGPWSSEVVRGCGELQGYIHSVAVPEGSPFADRHGKFEEWTDDVTANLIFLEESAVMGTDELDAIREATRLVPEQIAMGFIHKDLCAENLVQGLEGRMSVIDNESFTVGPYAYDLARTWYRWSMPAKQRMEYLEAYAEHRSPQDCVSGFPYWALVALLKVVVFRLNLDTVQAERPIQCLRLLLNRLHAGSSPREILLQCSLAE